MKFLLPIIALCAAQSATALTLEGSMQQGGYITGEVEPNEKLLLNDKEIITLKEGSFIFGFGRDAKPSHKLTVVKPNGKNEIVNLKVKQRDYKIQRINGLPKSKVNVGRSEKTQKRIAKEIAEIKKARSHITKTPYFQDGFIWPLKGRKTGVYGSQRILNGTPKQPHYGVDIAAPTGTKFIAPAGGIVRLVQKDNYFSGGTLFLDHGYGLFSAFLHMHAFDVKVGDEVKQGDVLGEVGSTGRSTGPHLDWRVNWFKERIDPELMVDEPLN